MKRGKRERDRQNKLREREGKRMRVRDSGRDGKRDRE